MTHATPSLAARLLRTSLAASLVLSCALGLGSCAQSAVATRAPWPAGTSAAPRRRTPPKVERCADEVVVVAAPVCG